MLVLDLGLILVAVVPSQGGNVVLEGVEVVLAISADVGHVPPTIECGRMLKRHRCRKFIGLMVQPSEVGMGVSK